MPGDRTARWCLPDCIRQASNTLCTLKLVHTVHMWAGQSVVSNRKMACLIPAAHPEEKVIPATGLHTMLSLGVVATLPHGRAPTLDWTQFSFAGEKRQCREGARKGMPRLAELCHGRDVKSEDQS